MFSNFLQWHISDLCDKHLNRGKLHCWEGEWRTTRGEAAVSWAGVLMPRVGSVGEGGSSQGRPKGNGSLLLKREEGS